MKRQTARKSWKQENLENLLPDLDLGENVLLQNPTSKLWDKSGKIVSVLANGRSYEVQDDEGVVCRRNRRFLRQIPCVDHEGEESAMSESAHKANTRTVTFSNAVTFI